MEVSALVTVPVPVPAFATVMVTGAVKVAVTATDPETLTVQVVPLVEVQPVQEAKVEPVAAVAVRVTVVPLDSLLEQVDPQLMRLSLEVTVPEPLPALVTVIPEAVTNVAVTSGPATENEVGGWCSGQSDRVCRGEVCGTR